MRHSVTTTFPVNHTTPGKEHLRLAYQLYASQVTDLHRLRTNREFSLIGLRVYSQLMREVLALLSEKEDIK